MSTNSIFILKPIWDALYEDAKKDREEMDALKRRIAECNEQHVLCLRKTIEELTEKVTVLETYNRELVLENNSLKSYTLSNPFDDAAYAAEADAPATSYIPVTSFLNEVVEPVMVHKEESVNANAAEEDNTKTVKMVGSKTKTEYQRDYQRAYREKKKANTMNVATHKA